MAISINLAPDAPDRRNGHYSRHLLRTLGDIELRVPRTRRYSPAEMLQAYARREAEIDRVILAGFVLRSSTHKVGETLLAMLGQKPGDRHRQPGGQDALARDFQPVGTLGQS